MKRSLIALAVLAVCTSAIPKSFQALSDPELYAELSPKLEALCRAEGGCQVATQLNLDSRDDAAFARGFEAGVLAARKGLAK